MKNNDHIKKFKIVSKPIIDKKIIGDVEIDVTALKPQQNVLKTNLYLGKLKSHNKKMISKVNHEANKNSGKTRTASANVQYGAPYFYHPLFEPSTLVLPTEFAETVEWCRYFYKYDALISASIDAHSELPLSKIRLNLPKCKDKNRAHKILEFYEDMIGNHGIDLFRVLLEIGKEYYKIGNVWVWLQLDEENKVWELISIIDPESIDIELFQLSRGDIVNLVPDDSLRTVISGGPSNEKTGQIYKSLPKEIIEHVQNHKDIPLSTDSENGSYVVHLARKMSDFDVLGTSLIERNFKTLVYKDRLRQSQDAIANRHLMPVDVISTPHEAGAADINDLRNQVEIAKENPDTAIITNYQVDWNQVGADQGLMQLSSEWDWIENELMIGTMTNKQFLLGEGPFAGGETVLEILSQRYAVFREIIEAFVENNIFLPIAKLNGFYEIIEDINKNKKKKYLYPTIRWNRINLYDDTNDKNFVSQLFNDGKVDARTWLEKLGLDADEILERLKEEQGTLF
ncbi:MAG: hypothetical protein WC934_15275, partial [Acidithiobacillus sp.]|uniref:hypothetical protein n=1 Tax=Acidithiobacillus sp. TaxID=1872118 RepID=UPI00355E5D8D